MERELVACDWKDVVVLDDLRAHDRVDAGIGKGKTDHFESLIRAATMRQRFGEIRAELERTGRDDPDWKFCQPFKAILIAG